MYITSQCSILTVLLWNIDHYRSFRNWSLWIAILWSASVRRTVIVCFKSSGFLQNHYKHAFSTIDSNLNSRISCSSLTGIQLTTDIRWQTYSFRFSSKKWHGFPSASYSCNSQLICTTKKFYFTSKYIYNFVPYSFELTKSLWAHPTLHQAHSLYHALVQPGIFHMLWYWDTIGYTGHQTRVQLRHTMAPKKEIQAWINDQSRDQV